MPNQTGKFVSCFHDGFSKTKKKVKSRSGDYFLCGLSDGEKNSVTLKYLQTNHQMWKKKYFSEFPQLSDFTYQDKNLG